MKQYMAVLVFFLLAFAGMATGLFLKRKGLHRGCGGTHDSGDDCRCKTSVASGTQESLNRPTGEKPQICCKERGG